MKKLKGIFGKGKGGSTSNAPSGGASASHVPQGYDLKEKDLPKIHKAAWTGDIAKVKQLAKKDSCSLDKENRTPLHLACANGHAKVVQELLEWNAKTNVGDNEAKTPLMKAVECNQEDCVKLLLEYRNEVDVRDRENNTALHLAVKDSNTSMVSMLIQAGANTNLKNRYGQTPLILSVLEPSKKDYITRMLLENNAEVNALDSNHRSALHHACMEDGINQVKLLLEYNANTALKDIKGWTAEDCAMMKANHACSQVVFDHNLKHRRLLGGSVPSTPRASESANLSRHTTPRDKSTASEVSDFGMPQQHREDAEDSDDQTISKQSLHDNRQDSWADDTDISAADDKLKDDSSDGSDMDGFVYSDKAGAVKTSLTKHLHIDSDDEEIEDLEDNKAAVNGKPGDLHGKVRPMYSRSPTPDRDLAGSPATAPSPQAKSTPSKIPVKQRLSGASHTSVEEDFTDDDDDEDDSSPIQRTSGRVSFSDHQQVRNISATDDDTDIEDDEEEAEPPKKRRIGNPDDSGSSSGYTPTGYQFDAPESKPLSQDKMKATGQGQNAMMADLGMDDISDVSDPDDLDDSEPAGGNNSLPNTPRGILKKTETSGKPPSVQKVVDTDAYWDSEDDDSNPNEERAIVVEAEIHPATRPDSPSSPIFKDEESDWDSTKQSLTEKGSQSIQIREEVESPEIDSDIENTLNPEKSVTSKTSQWDSSEEAFTPRTPRDSSQAFIHNDLSPGVGEFEYEDESESRSRDHIEDAMTSFGTKQMVPPSPSLPTPEPQSDSTAPRSRDTPDPTTSSQSGSMQKTVIAAQVDEPDESPAEQEDENSDWDSEDDVQSDEEVDGSTPVVGVDSPVVVGIDSIENTPRTPRADKSEEESISEWEIEREKEKQQKQQEEMRILQEMEEEEERQRKWEEEERRRQAQIEREAQEELERERLAEDDIESDMSDFSDNQLPDSARKPGSDHSQISQHASLKSQLSGESERSQRTESLTSPRGRELKKPPPKLVVSKFIPPVHSMPWNNKSPVTMGEIENESPAPDFFDEVVEPVQEQHRFASQNQTPDFEDKSKESGNMYSGANGEEEESDNDIEEINDEQADGIHEFTDDMNKQDEFHVETGVGVKVQYQKSTSFVTQQNFDEDDEDEFEDGVDAELILPETVKKVEAAGKPTTFERSELPVNGDLKPQKTNGALTEPPPLPKSGPPGKAMSLQSDGQSADEDYLESHIHLSKPSGPSGLPDLSGTTGLYSSGLEVPFDDDGLSVTSTENGDISSSYRPENLPYGKDMLVNMNLTDSGSILKLQEHLREHRKQLEYERNQKMLLESRQKQSAKDKADQQKMIDSLKYQKSALEQSKLDLEAKIRNLEYSVNDEEEKKKNAELLLKKTKEQLAKKEEQYTQEMEAKQRAELSMRNVQMELRSAQNTVKDLEEEKAELDRQLANEKNARQLQEKINEEQQRLQQHIQEESMKTSSQRDDDSEDARNALELADDDIKHARDLVEKYKNEIAALKAELQRQRTRLTDENTMLSTENEKLQQRVDDLKSDVKDHEEALTQMTVQHNLHNSKLVSEATMLSDNLDKERVAREKVEAELNSLRTRLQASTVQLEKSQHARNDFERRLHGDREEWARQLDRKEQELVSLKEKIQAHIQALNSTETKLNAVENELQISNTTLLERTNQYQQIQRDLQYHKTAQENHDVNVRHEKEQNAKHVAKIESLQDKLSSLQHENLNLKQQVDSAQLVANDRAGFDLQDKLNTMISSLKADHEKARASLEDKNNNLQDNITRLREEVRNSENRRSNLEQDIRRLNQEQNELIRKLSIAEASLDVASKARENLEQERLTLKMEIEKLQQRYNAAQEKTIEAQTRMGDLVDKLDRTEQSRMLSSQQLADTSATMQAFNVSKSELEENYQKVQVENVRLDAELKHEKQKTEMLQRDLADSQKVRSSLEALCSNLKSTNAHLEEKLGPDQLREVTASGEVVSRNLLQKEAEDHKGLWEQEVLSRSKLGLRIAQLERHKQETSTQLEEEKRRTRKALEQKKLAETKLEAEQDKVTNLQKEVANLKAYLKVAKKRLKEPGSDEVLDSNENRLSNLHTAFDKERQAMEEMLVSVKSQLEHMKIQLQDETEEKDRIQQKNLQLEAELKTIKKLERSVQKIDRSKKKLEEEFRVYKNSVETGYTEKSTVEEAKKEIESRYRQELNRKLDEVNNYLEDQARTRQRLDLSRDEQEAKIRNEKKKFEEECTDLRIKFEQSLAKLEMKDLEAKRYRDLYESEMQWRMRLSEQLYRSTDKAFGFKNKLVAERQKNRMSGSMSNLSMNGHMLDISKINGSMTDDALSSRLRAELDRSIAKHLEAAPHDQIRPHLRTDDPVLGSSNFAKASADYIEVLKRKFCV